MVLINTADYNHYIHNTTTAMRVLLILLILSFIHLNSSANNNPQIISFTRDQYKADNKNWSISQDPKGIMYFGNDMGLLEFDGIEWKLYRLSNGLIVRSVAALSYDVIFTGGYEEFGRWDRDVSGKLLYTSLSDSLDRESLKNDDFWKIIVTDSGVYFQSFNSIYLYDYKTIKRVDTDVLLLFLANVRDRFFVQSMQKSVFELKNNKLIKLPGSEIFENTDVRVILPFGADKYLFGTSRHGIYIYDGHSFSEWNASLSNKLKMKELNSAAFSSERGTYFLGTILDGIYEVDRHGTILDHISAKNNLPNNTVLSLFEDNTGNIWAALDRGLSYIRYLKNMSYFIDSSGDTGMVYDAKIWNGNLFLATNQGVFYMPENDLSKGYSLSDKRLVEGSQGQVWSLTIIDGKLYCGQNKGLGEITKDMKMVFPYKLDIGVFRISQAKIRDKEVLILSTYSSIKIIEKSTNEIIDFNQLSEPILNTVVDHLNNIWLEHNDKGVYKCQLSPDFKSFSNIKHYGGDTMDGLPYKLKLFKVGGRIELLGDDKFYTYDDIADTIVLNDKLNKCFASVKNLKQITHVKDNQFWALTSTSAYKFTYDGYNAKIDESFVIAVDNLSMVYKYENLSVLNDSEVLVCLDNGFIIYRSTLSEDGNNKKVLPIPFFESIQIGNIQGDTDYLPVHSLGEIAFKFNTITFNFLADNVFSDNLTFQFMLENVDSDWVQSQKVNKVTYTRLPEGKYTFMIRTVDSQGNFSEPLLYEFEVNPPWYQSFWAYLSYVMLIIILTIIVWLSILRYYHKINRRRQRIWEAEQLGMKNEQLQIELEQKDAEMLTQTSFIIQKNELLLKLKEIVDEFYLKNSIQALVPLHHKINAMLNNNLDAEEDWKMFLIKFEQKHTGFFKLLKSKYPELTSNDLKLCACLKLNLDTKDIASLMNLSVRAIENSRYRLRKKLNIQPTQNLNDFFMNLS